MTSKNGPAKWRRLRGSRHPRSSRGRPVCKLPRSASRDQVVFASLLVSSRADNSECPCEHWRSRRALSLTARIVGELLTPHDRADVNARGDHDYAQDPEDCDPTPDRGPKQYASKKKETK